MEPRLRRHRLLLAGLLIVILLLPSLGAQSQDLPVTVDYLAERGQGPASFGTNVWWSDQDATVWTAQWQNLHLALARMFVPHAILEPVNDDGDPNVVRREGFLFDTPIQVPAPGERTLTYRSWLTALRDQPDVQVMLYSPYLAPWLSQNEADPLSPITVAPYPPNDLAEYREYLIALLEFVVDDVGFPPDRLLFEAANEPDVACGPNEMVPCFWQNWTSQDIADVVRVTHEAVVAVDPRIRVVGLAEANGTGVLRQLLDDYSEGAYLDAFSIHFYSPSGWDLGPVFSRQQELAPYGKPLYLDEYGTYQYVSQDTGHALWHSLALPALGSAGIIPVQFPISTFPLEAEPFNSMGLFADWRGDWQTKPVYWVYANYSSLIGGMSDPISAGTSRMIAYTAPDNLDVLATRRSSFGRPTLSLWITNRTDSSLLEQRFEISNFPAETATVSVCDNLLGPTPIMTTTVTGATLRFSLALPALSSRTVTVAAGQSNAWLYLPLFLKGSD